MKKLILAAVIAGGLLGWGLKHFGAFGPTSYEECILENMKGGQGDVAARLIARACREKFPDKRSRAFTHTLQQSNYFDQFDSQEKRGADSLFADLPLTKGGKQ